MKINVSEIRQAALSLRTGEKIELSGYIYTARDAAHLKIEALLESGGEMPFDIKDAVIYYAGPTPTPEPVMPVNSAELINTIPSLAIGSCGPTTSGRMDRFTPELLDRGLAGMIGKGERSEEVVCSIVKNKAVYFAAVGGAGALAAKCVKSCEVVAFSELGCESVKKLLVKDFPLIAAIDSFGGDIFKEGIKIYSKMV